MGHAPGGLRRECAGVERCFGSPLLDPAAVRACRPPASARCAPLSCILLQTDAARYWGREWYHSYATVQRLEALHASLPGMQLRLEGRELLLSPSALYREVAEASMARPLQEEPPIVVHAQAAPAYSYAFDHGHGGGYEEEFEDEEF